MFTVCGIGWHDLPLRRFGQSEQGVNESGY